MMRVAISPRFAAINFANGLGLGSYSSVAAVESVRPAEVGTVVDVVLLA